MLARLACTVLLLASLACDAPAHDSRGTLGNAVQVDLRLHGLSDELLQFQGLGSIPLKLDLSSAPSDANVRTELQVADNQALVVVPSRGDPITYQGTPLRAEYHHVGRLLVVAQGTGDVRVIHNFVEPVRWYTILRNPP